MKISEQQVRYVARLAKLELSASEVARMVHDLDAILGYVDLLESADLAGVPPTAHPLDLETPLRPDVAGAPLSVEDAVASAPAHSDGAFLVPKVIE